MLLRFTAAASAAVFGAMTCPDAEAAPDLRKKIQLQVRQPATVRLANTSVIIKGAVTSPEYAPVQGSLVERLESELHRNEPTLQKPSDPVAAEWTLALQVTGYSLGQPQRRTDTVRNTTTNYVRWAGSLNVSYDVLGKDGKVHAADNVDYSYNEEFVDTTNAGRGPTISLSRVPWVRGKVNKKQPPQSQDELKQTLIQEVVERIARKLGNTTETVEVSLPGGDDQLNLAATFMEQRLWARALEHMEKMPAYSKPADEAYRQYGLGVAYEAMSYAANNFNEQKTNLFKAQEHYDKALKLKPNEEYFVRTIARTRDSVAQTVRLEQMRLADRKALLSTTAPAKAPDPQPAKPQPAPAPAPQEAARAKALTLAKIIEMRDAGVNSADIIHIIQASDVEFDPFSADTAIAVAKAKLPIDIQNELRKKVGAPLLKEPSAAAKPPRKSPPAKK
jgi:hypothetical protein